MLCVYIYTYSEMKLMLWTYQNYECGWFYKYLTQEKITKFCSQYCQVFFSFLFFFK